MSREDRPSRNSGGVDLVEGVSYTGEVEWAHRKRGATLEARAKYGTTTSETGTLVAWTDVEAFLEREDGSHVVAHPDSLELAPQG